MGKIKHYTPEELWESFEKYKEETKARRRIVPKATPRGIVNEEHIPPLTISGFKVFCAREGGDIQAYWNNRDDKYSEYSPIRLRIDQEIKQDQIEGGMVGQYNASITQRLNGLTEKTDVTSNGDNIGGKIEVEIVTRNENKSN